MRRIRNKLSFVVVASLAILVVSLMGKFLADVFAWAPKSGDYVLATTRSQLSDLYDAITEFRVRFGRFPELSSKLTFGQGAAAYEMQFGEARDYWGNYFVIMDCVTGATGFKVVSLGPDGKLGGGDDLEVP